MCVPHVVLFSFIYTEGGARFYMKVDAQTISSLKYNNGLKFKLYTGSKAVAIPERKSSVHLIFK